MTDTMQSLTPIGGDVTVEGAVSIEETVDGVHPWRLPIHRRDLFEPSVVNKASMPAGVRLTFISDTSSVILGIANQGVAPDPPWVFDLLVDGELHQRLAPTPDADSIRFTDVPDGEHRLELYLPSQYAPVVIRALKVDAGATVRGWQDVRRRIVFYGSSITHCRHAAGPSETWPALVAGQFDLHLTSLGYGGDCHMDQVVGRMIADLPADFIGLKIGINMMGALSASDRSFRAMAIGLIETIRDGHPDTPMALVSPICHPPNETTQNAAGMTLQLMRQRLAEACQVLCAQGDDNLHYVDGLSVMGPNDVHLYIDGIHPSAEGYRFLAAGWAREVAPRLGLT
ncbi:MAG: SGNH/GDSL hydrolase family protein [Candidatus Latescibacteria bacterium]|jgi:lysophospholipase L1-like esterase|nr:SGNH/GDSL hydrolase family protein [Candidatus Latescibacterota bacterium]